jgi:hypothetical protein
LHFQTQTHQDNQTITTDTITTTNMGYSHDVKSKKQIALPTFQKLDPSGRHTLAQEEASAMFTDSLMDEEESSGSTSAERKTNDKEEDSLFQFVSIPIDNSEDERWLFSTSSFPSAAEVEVVTIVTTSVLDAAISAVSAAIRINQNKNRNQSATTSSSSSASSINHKRYTNTNDCEACFVDDEGFVVRSSAEENDMDLEVGQEVDDMEAQDMRATQEQEKRAAICIQRIVRGWQGRGKALGMFVLDMQRVARGYLVRKRIEKRLIQGVATIADIEVSLLAPVSNIDSDDVREETARATTGIATIADIEVSLAPLLNIDGGEGETTRATTPPKKKKKGLARKIRHLLGGSKCSTPIVVAATAADAADTSLEKKRAPKTAPVKDDEEP